MPPPAEALIAGCGRSGTTWLAEIVNHDDAWRFIFEPLHPDLGVGLARTLGSWRYLRPSCREPALVGGLVELLEGRFANAWTDRFTRAGNARRLIKEVRAHFLLGWISDVRPDLPIVLLLRHPCAVAASEIRMGWTGWREPLDAMVAQPELMADHLEPFRDVILSASSVFEQRIVLWCVRTLVPLRQLARGAAHVVFYESLATDPDGQLPALFAAIGRPYDAASARRAWARRSAMTVATPGVAPTTDPLRAWRATVGAADAARARVIVDRFGLGGLYDAEGWPDPSWPRTLPL